MSGEPKRAMTGVPHCTFKVREEEEPQRLDLFLSGKIANCSRSQLKRLTVEGRVLVNGTMSKPGYEVRGGDRIEVWLPAVDSAHELVPRPMSLDILYEDDDIVVVNKAPGIVVHPGAGREQGTLVHGLLAHCGKLAMQGAPQRPGIVHRLDRDTSGALVVAKSERAYLNLVNQFKEHQVAKEYLTLVYGQPSETGGDVTTVLGRHPRDRKKIAVVQHRGREAVSHWQVAKQWGGVVALLRVAIETGRTHQIRVHLKHIHHPVVGDQTYGGDQRRARTIKLKPLRDLLLTVDRQMLHAQRLAFRHPRTGGPLSFTAPLPADFAFLISRLDQIFEIE